MKALVEEQLTKDFLERYGDSYQKALKVAAKVILVYTNSNQYEIKSRAEETFKNLLRKMKPEVRNRLVVKLLSEYASKSKNAEYQFIIEQLYRVFPKLNEFIIHRYGTNGVITPEGTKILVEYLKNKGSLQIPCSVCADLPEFKTGIKSFVEGANKSAMCCIVKFPKEGIHHLTAIYVEKDEQTLQFIMTDSMGIMGPYALPLCKHIETALSETGIKNYNLYLYSRTRQHDTTSCPVFCLRDVVQYSKTHHFLRFVQVEADSKKSQSLKKNPNLKHVIVFNNLPPAMLKTTQSLTFIKNQDSEQPSISLYDSVEKHRITLLQSGSQKEINNLINERFLKYERLIFARVIGQGLKARTKQSG